jgi:2-phosphosulfolactate phosphatase
VVIDVFRASTTVVRALVNGCRMLIPVLTPEEARARAREFGPGEALLAGERGGRPIPGFDLGNSPREFTRERARNRVVIFTTTNGTRALAAATPAAATAVGALVNARAVAAWIVAQGRDLTLVCSGEVGALSLEDTVCAGLILDAVAEAGCVLEMTDAARVCRVLAAHYRRRLDALLVDSFWARELDRLGYGSDLAACIELNVHAEVPVLDDGAIKPSGSVP